MYTYTYMHRVLKLIWRRTDSPVFFYGPDAHPENPTGNRKISKIAKSTIFMGIYFSVSLKPQPDLFQFSSSFKLFCDVRPGLDNDSCLYFY